MPESHSSELYHVLSPEGPLGVTPLPAAPRPGTLTGKKIAFVWDYAFRGDEMFPVIEDGLRETFGAVDFVGPDAFGTIFGGDEEAVLDALPEKLKDLGVDAVVCGVGC